MIHPMTLSLMGLLSLVGAGAGVYLGKSAVGEIDPVYFSSPERGSRWHADLSPYRSSVAAPELSGSPGMVYASGSCIGCTTYPEEYYPVHDASIDRYEKAWAEVREPEVQVAVYQPSSSSDQPARDADLALIDRYARRPTTGDDPVEGPEIEVEPAGPAEGSEPLNN